MNTKTKNIILLLFVVLLSVPFIQEIIGAFDAKQIDGKYSKELKPEFSAEKWFNGEFQVSYEKYIENNIGFRNFLVRLKNQLDYTFFNLSNAENVIVGKKNYLFEKNYIEEYLGTNFQGKENLDKKIDAMQKATEILRSKNIPLILFVTPGKGEFYKEYIPDNFNKLNKKTSNYEYITAKLKSQNLPFFDAHNWFLKIKDKSKHPLYPKTGIHWSYYGACLAMDSLCSFMNKIKPGPWSELALKECTPVNEARSPDADLGILMNLLSDIKEMPLAYPEIIYENSPPRRKPNILVIGDSFYWNWYYYGLIENLFSNADFWYYNHMVYPASHTKETTLDNINFKETIEKQDFIILLTTQGCMGNLGHGFVEKLISEYSVTNIEEKINMYIQKIKNDEAWLNIIKKKAIDNKIELEKQIRLDAEYMAKTN